VSGKFVSTLKVVLRYRDPSFWIHLYLLSNSHKFNVSSKGGYLEDGNGMGQESCQLLSNVLMNLPNWFQKIKN